MFGLNDLVQQVRHLQGFNCGQGAMVALMSESEVDAEWIREVMNCEGSIDFVLGNEVATSCQSDDASPQSLNEAAFSHFGNARCIRS